MCIKFKPNTMEGEEVPQLFKEGEIEYKNVNSIEMESLVRLSLQQIACRLGLTTNSFNAEGPSEHLLTEWGEALTKKLFCSRR